MPNGKPGDHPLNDIVVHHLPVYSEAIDSLIRKISVLGGNERIAELLFFQFNPIHNPDLDRLETVLTSIHADLAGGDNERGDL